MAEKKFDTRILLKYDSLANWNGSSLVLKAGEVAIATVPTTEAVTKQDGVITPPAAVVFKVGDGEHAFKDLPIVSALAADVYGWAKKSEDELIAWLSDAENGAGFATDAELAAIKTALEAKDKTLEDLINAIEGGGEGSEGGLTGVYTRLSDLEVILNSFLPEGEEGVVSDAVKNAIDAVAGSVTTLSERVNGIDASIDSIEAAQSTMSADIAALKKQVIGEDLGEGEESLVGKVNQSIENIDAIEASIGEVPAEKTVVGMIGDAEAAAKAHADSVAGAVDAKVVALEPRVKANEDAIVVLNGTGEGSVKKQVADAIAEVVADAPENFDTLKEVSDWIANDQTGAAALQNKVNAHEGKIAALEGADATLQTNIDDLEKDLISRIEAITGSEGSTGTLAALEQRVKANEDAIDIIEGKIGEVAEGQSLASLIAAQGGKISGIEGTVNDHTTLLEGLRTDLNAEVERAKGAEKTLADNLAAEIERATAAEGANDTAIKGLSAKIDGLHPVATTGSINSLTQDEDGELIFDCGNATGYTKVQA